MPRRGTRRNIELAVNDLADDVVGKREDVVVSGAPVATIWKPHGGRIAQGSVGNLPCVAGDLRAAHYSSGEAGSIPTRSIGPVWSVAIEAPARPDNRTIAGAMNPRSALRVSTMGNPLATSAFQSKLE